MFAVDTNISVYAHNLDSPFHQKAKAFVESVIREDPQDNFHHEVGIPLQACAEFVNVCTRQTIEKPLSIQEAISIIREYAETLGVPIILPQNTQLQTFLMLLETTTTRKKVFDVMLAATLKDNSVEGLYTVNIDDFKDFTFLKVENPLLKFPMRIHRSVDTLAIIRRLFPRISVSSVQSVSPKGVHPLQRSAKL